MPQQPSRLKSVPRKAVRFKKPSFARANFRKSAPQVSAKSAASTSPKKTTRGWLRSIFKPSSTRLKITESDLINAESALGATLFGPIPQGHRREFFRYNHNVWIFHENWEENGSKRESTITYEVRENGVYKLPLGGQYVKIKEGELENFCKATTEYLKLIKAKLY